MTREKAAAALMLLLVAISVWNIRSADRLCEAINAEILQCSEHAQQENWEQAHNSMENALDMWLAAESYTHIFIRHPEIDSCSDVFYDAMGAISDEGKAELEASLSKLHYHLKSIASMEHVSIGNIF